MALAGPTCSIGSSPGCDVLLIGDDIAATHVRIHLYGSNASVEAIDGDVGREGQSPVTAGYGYRAALPLDFLLGDTHVRISRKVTEGRRLKPLVIGAGAFLLLTLIVMALARATDPSPDEQRTSVSAITDGARGKEATEAVRQLRARIDGAGLSALRLVDNGGRIEVSGHVSPEDMAVWHNIEQWFDATYGEQYMLASLVEAGTSAATPHVRLQAVWLGEQPYVIDGRGERRYPGDPLTDGWMVKSIEADHVTVSRDGQDVAIAL